MEVQPPSPWEELLNVLCFSSTPIKTGLLWLDRTNQSSFFLKKPNFDELLIYLVSSVPKVDADHKLILETKISRYPAILQSRLLQFLKLNINSVTCRCVDKVQNHLIQFHGDCDVSKQLVQLLKSKSSNYYVPEVFLSSTINDVTTKKRLNNHVSGKEFPVAKKTRLHIVSQDACFTDTDKIQEFCMFVKNKEFEKVIDLLTSLKVSFSEDMHDMILRTLMEVEEDFMLKVGLHLIMIKSKFDNHQAISYFLSICHIYLKLLKKTPSRQVMLMFIQIVKDLPEIFTKFVTLLIHMITINNFLPTFIVNLSKQTLTKQQQSILFCDILKNKQLPISNLDAAIAIYLGFMNLKISIDEQSLLCLCDFFEIYAKSASKSFNFAKLLLSFLKNSPIRFLMDNLSVLHKVISFNDSSLKTSCKMILDAAKSK